MTQETVWLDYTKPLPGFDPQTLERSLQMTVITAGVWGPRALAAAWSYYKREHAPPGLQVFVWPKEKASDPPTAWCVALRGKVHFAAFEGDEGEGEARAAAWAWHDRRRAIVLDIDDQTCSGGKNLGAWMTAALSWTDAECSEVEAYAALPFPRSIDMPQALQRVLLPQGAK